MPCPTSKAVIHISPYGRAGTFTSNGSHVTAPSQRNGQPRGASIHSMPNNASANIGQEGIGADHTAAGIALSHSSACASHSTTQCAMPSSQSHNGLGKTLPIKASGVTTKLMSGMANALASGLTSDIWPNNRTVKGTSPSVTAYWVLAAARKAGSGIRQPASCLPPTEAAMRPTVAYRMIATTPNESQNPGHNTALGSNKNTAANAKHSTCDTLAIRPTQSAQATTDSMYSVRCAGLLLLVCCSFCCVFLSFACAAV